MRIAGTATLAAPVDQVWGAILDPAVLARTLPGCEALSVVGDDRYAMTVTAGVAAIKGTYSGEVALSDQVAPESLTLRASGAGAPGTVDAEVRVRFSPSESGGTEVSYEADASVGGAVGGVGQRMLAGVTRKMAGQFFAALDADLAGEAAGEADRVPEHEIGAAPDTVTAARTPDAAAPAAAASYPGRRALARADANATANISLDSGATFAAGAVLGGLLALAGVAIGARIGRGSRVAHAERGTRRGRSR
ncbi:MAG: SRPBCC family protein [Dermatophilaceae bacterium]